MEIRNRIKELRQVKASEILQNPKNWRKHPMSQAKALKGMLGEIGYADALIAYESDEGLMLIDGHLRAETTPDMEVPVLITDLSEDEADKLLATLDPLAAMAQNDKTALSDLMDNINFSNDTTNSMLAELRRISDQARGIYEPEYVSPDDVFPHPRNYVTHPEDQIQHLAQSMLENGFYRNVVTAKDGTILAGHGVVEAAKRIELEMIPIIRLNIDADDPRALKLLTADNEVSHLSEKNDRALTEILKEINDLDPNNLLGTGYDSQMLASLAMVTRPKSEIQDFDAAKEWLGMPAYENESPSDRLQLLVFFEDSDARDTLVRHISEKNSTFKPVKRSDKAWHVWYPPKQNDDVASVRFMENE
jgi:hypothetical protein